MARIWQRAAHILAVLVLLVGVAVAQEGQWPYHPTHPKGPPGQQPDPIYADLTQAQRDAVNRALDALWGLLACPWLDWDAMTVLMGEVIALEQLLASGDIVSWSGGDPDSIGLRTQADMMNQQGDSIFNKNPGNAISVDGFKPMGNAQSFGSASTSSGNDAMFGAFLAAELGHQDMHCRMTDSGGFRADPVGTPGGLNHWQMMQSFSASEVEVSSRAITLLDAFLVCPPPLNALDAKRFAQTKSALESFRKMHGG